MQFLGWLCHRFGFGTYLHYIQGPLDREHFKASRCELARLVALTHARGTGVYVDTIVSPSMPSALAQSLQIPGVSGMDNNLERRRRDLRLHRRPPARRGPEHFLRHPGLRDVLWVQAQQQLPIE